MKCCLVIEKKMTLKNAIRQTNIENINVSRS